jgi:hypothetical protein
MLSSANIGSALTIMGNPKNMLIQESTGIGFLDFLYRMLVPCLVALVLNYTFILIFFRTKFKKLDRDDDEESSRGPLFQKRHLPGDLMEEIHQLANSSHENIQEIRPTNLKGKIEKLVQQCTTVNGLQNCLVAVTLTVVYIYKKPIHPS